MKNICRIATAMIIVLSLFSAYRINIIGTESVLANGSVTIEGVSSNKFVGDLTLPHTTGGGENRLFLVSVAWGTSNTGGSARTITEILFRMGDGDVPLELVTQASFDKYNNVAIYRYPDEAPEDQLGEVYINFSMNTVNVVVGAINFAGVDFLDSFRSIENSTGIDLNPNLNLATQNGDIVFDTVSTLYSILTAGDDQEPRWNLLQDNDNYDQSGAASTKIATSSITSMNWTSNDGQPWAMAAVAIKPAQQTTPGIGDFVWIDINRNGIQDIGEPGLSDVVVELFQDDNTVPYQTAFTDQMGFYFFENVPPGTYYLKFSHQSMDLTFSTPNQGSDSSIDSDVDELGTTSRFSYIEGTITDTLDAGVLSHENPPLSASCGLDIVLVIDSSASIDEIELPQMKNAFYGFVDAFLPATPTTMAVVEFDDDAAVTQSWTNDVSLLNAAIGAATNDGSTNYSAALSTAYSLFNSDRDDEDYPNLIIFASDGAPNPGDDEWQITQQTIKDDGIRILSIGIGLTNLDNLIKISGPIVSPTTYPISVDTDVITTDFISLASALQTLATDMCGGTCTIHNIIDPDGSLDYDAEGNITPEEDWITEGAGVANWPFTISTSDDSIKLATGQNNPALTNMDGHSIIYFEILSNPASFSLQETLPSGWFLLDVACFYSGQAPLTVTKNLETALVEDIGFGNNADLLTCYFYNYPSPTAVTLLSFTAKVQGESVRLEWETASEIDNLGFNLYREDLQSGLTVKINPDLIPSQAPGSTEGAFYDFVDDSAIFGQPYAYWLESIDLKMRVKDTHGPARVLWWQFFLPIFSVGP